MPLILNTVKNDKFQLNIAENLGNGIKRIEIKLAKLAEYC